MKKTIGNVVLEQMALEAANNAYSPYSKFKVGAALLDDRGRVFVGCNMENASYGLTLCAERSAFAAAIAAGSRKFVKLAIASSGVRPARPCGACLQVISEFCGPDFPITLCTSGKRIEARLGSFLPQPFKMASGVQKR